MRAIDRATSEALSGYRPSPDGEGRLGRRRFVLSDYPQAERIGIGLRKGNNGGDGLPWPASSSKRGVLCPFCCCVIRKSFAGIQRLCFRSWCGRSRPLEECAADRA